MDTRAGADLREFVTWTRLMWILGIFFTASMSVQAGITHFVISGVREAVAQHNALDTHTGAVKLGEWHQFLRVYDQRRAEEREERKDIRNEVRALRQDIRRDSTAVLKGLAEIRGDLGKR